MRDSSSTLNRLQVNPLVADAIWSCNVQHINRPPTRINIVAGTTSEKPKAQAPRVLASVQMPPRERPPNTP